MTVLNILTMSSTLHGNTINPVQYAHLQARAYENDGRQVPGRIDLLYSRYSKKLRVCLLLFPPLPIEIAVSSERSYQPF